MDCQRCESCKIASMHSITKDGMCSDASRALRALCDKQRTHTPARLVVDSRRGDGARCYSPAVGVKRGLHNRPTSVIIGLTYSFKIKQE